MEDRCQSQERIEVGLRGLSSVKYRLRRAA